MAILNDLSKETSFRRFYLRWLVATWLPAIVAADACPALAVDALHRRP
jgi:hypothetical protein